jgi:putative ATP-binding cassette transporter
VNLKQHLFFISNNKKLKTFYSGNRRITLLILLLLGIAARTIGQQPPDTALNGTIDAQVTRLMHAGGIPGLSLVFIKDGRQYIRSYGYADLEKRMPVTARTLFQLGSCSKAFVALAVLQLARENKLKLDAPVSDYLPWFQARYRDSPVRITIRQLLHHTSGIPWQSIALIPALNDPDALETTVRKVSGIALHHLPGHTFEYATVNYDILALLIQQQTGEPFESYLRRQLLEKLQLPYTTIGTPADSSLMATGYKIGFFRPRPYQAPVYKGNNAAGYIISNALDMGAWLRFQLGLGGLPQWYALAQQTRQRDETVTIHGTASYAMGWDVSLTGNGEIYHGGLNPNFTSYIAFRPASGTGVAVLANSNSGLTELVGENVLRLLNGEKAKKADDPGDGNDRLFSAITIALGAFILVLVFLLSMVIYGIFRSARQYRPLTAAGIGTLAGAVLILSPFLLAIYLLPEALAGFNWHSIFVWMPQSFKALLLLLLIAIAVTCMTSLITFLFPEPDRFKRLAPRLIALSILSGVANILVILLVTSSLNTGIRLRYLVFYYALAASIYLFGNRFVQISLIKFTRGLIYELRVKLVTKILATSCQKFERLDRGRVYTALNDDVETLGGSADQVISLVTNVFTAIGAFVFLASIAFWASALTILLILAICTVYYFVGKSTDAYFKAARDTRNVFMRLVNGMIDGFKEISLHNQKKAQYKAEISGSANEYREKISLAGIRFANAYLVGESMLILLMGIVVFAVPRLFPDIRSNTIVSFVIVLLYLIGPVNAILHSVPAIMQLKIAWQRIRQFLKDIPANLDRENLPLPYPAKVESFKAEGLEFHYENADGTEGFHLGPMQLEVKSGEILFIIGGNGSGKTTLAKLLTGLYLPNAGRMLVNDRPVASANLGEYFSVVFSPSFLFPKLYNTNLEGRADELSRYLKLLDLEGKVGIRNNEYSTIALSGGQRKRLALLQCYLENSPIYLFDEWAADQDPGYRHFFYRTLLPEMKNKGKLVIAITHDDHYFDVADRVLKMRDGKLESYKGDLIFA